MDKQIFAYIVHKQGVVDDTAFEMINAAKKINSDASITAIVTGSGTTPTSKEPL